MCALLALVGGVVFIALAAVRVSLVGAAACGLGVTFGSAWLLAARRVLRDAGPALMLGFSFAFVLLEWPLLVLLALAVVTTPRDWG